MVSPKSSANLFLGSSGNATPGVVFPGGKPPSFALPVLYNPDWRTQKSGGFSGKLTADYGELTVLKTDCEHNHWNPKHGDRVHVCHEVYTVDMIRASLDCYVLECYYNGRVTV